MAFYCHRCGSALPTGARFCSSCGTVVAGAAPAQSRPLMRPRAGRQIAGVCAALAQSYGWDVALVRIITVVSCLFTGGLVGIAYLAGWVGIPEEPLDASGAYPPRI